MRFLLALPTSSLAVLGVVTLVALSLLGVVSDMVLRDRGYGVVVNGIFVTVGALLGIATQFSLSGLV